MFDNQDGPAGVAVLVDMSGSMSEPTSVGKKVKSAVESLSRFIRTSHKSNEYFIIGFNQRLHLLLDGSRDADAAIAALEKINSLEFRGPSSIYDVVYATLIKLDQASYHRRAVILITDGFDTFSRKRLRDVRRLLEEKNAVFYVVNVGSGGDRFSYSATAAEVSGREALKVLADVSGGGVFDPLNHREMDAAVERISAELRSQYLVGFVPAKPLAAGKCYSLKVKVTPPDGLSLRQKDLSVKNRKIHCVGEGKL